MQPYIELIHSVFKTYSVTKNRCLEEHSFSSFDVDFEIYLALFFGIYIDGKPNRDELQFLAHACSYLNWTDTYRQLMEKTIAQRPHFNYTDLTLSKKFPELAFFMYRIVYAAIKIDGSINDDEETLLKNLAFYYWSNDQHPNVQTIRQEIDTLGHQQTDRLIHEVEKQTPDASKPPTASTRVETAKTVVPVAVDPQQSVEECLAELDKLIGLQNVKQEVRRLIGFLTIQNERKKHDLPQHSLSLHMVFTGNPGTGKTTVARIVAKIYRALGFLKKGHLIETDRGGLVGQFIGHTDAKTSQVVQDALDGFLFIDEAYSLYKESENDFGQEAIDTLVKRMEDYRDRLVVIVAGYVEEMKSFIESNPGLRSRFNTYIDFPDYTAEELIEIFKLLCAKQGYQLEETAFAALNTVFQKALEGNRRSFGNGRFVRNCFENTLKNQAMRLINHEMGNLSKDDLILIKAEDLLQ